MRIKYQHNRIKLKYIKNYIQYKWIKLFNKKAKIIRLHEKAILNYMLPIGNTF